MAITSAVDRLCHPHTNGRMAMKTFLLSTILATAFTFTVSVAAAGPCGDSSNCDEWPEISIAQSCPTLDCRCGGC